MQKKFRNVSSPKIGTYKPLSQALRRLTCAALIKRELINIGGLPSNGLTSFTPTLSPIDFDRGSGVAKSCKDLRND